jgi:hypothetical protein
MARRLHDERFVDDDRARLEAGVEIAVRPLVGASPIGSAPAGASRNRVASTSASALRARRRRRARRPAAA